MLRAVVSHVEDCPDLGTACNGPNPPAPYRHHVALFLNETALDASIGIAPWLAAEARVGFRVVDVSPTFYAMDGAQLPMTRDIHHKPETIAGPFDPWLVLRVGAASGKLVVASRIGITIPIGSTVPDPYVLSAQGKEHEHIQLGTGTFVPIVGGAAAWLGERVQPSLTAVGLLSFYANGQGFRAPTRWYWNARTTFVFGAWRPYVAVDYVHEGREIWHGEPGSESYVRSELLAGAGVAWEFARGFTADLGVRAKVASFTDAATLDYPGILQLAIASRFDLGKRHDEHAGHAHE